MEMAERLATILGWSRKDTTVDINDTFKGGRIGSMIGLADDDSILGSFGGRRRNNAMKGLSGSVGRSRCQ